MIRILPFLVALLFITIGLAAQTPIKSVLNNKPDKEVVQKKNYQKNYLRGTITNSENELLKGVNIIINGTSKAVNSNENGDYWFNGLNSGKITVKASYVGYKAQVVDYMIHEGENVLDFVLNEENIRIAPITVTTQKREQQLIDVPLPISVIDATFIEKSNITELGQLSNYVPGLTIKEQGLRSTFIIRGLTSFETSPCTQPRVSVFFNNAPASRASGSSIELFDMEQVEIIKGPQGTLFGKAAQIGAIHFVSKKPTNNFNGYVTSGVGNFGKQEFRGAINSSLIKNKLFVRVAGIYNKHEGYIENTFGGSLNGKNTLGGRFSIRFLPSPNKKLDFVVNYQKDNPPGVAFMSNQFPNTEGKTGIFNTKASLNKGKDLFSHKNIFDGTINYKQYINDHNYWTSISSYRNLKSASLFDGDGTASAAFDFNDNGNSWQVFQELRFNFSLSSRLTGFIGTSFWYEKGDQIYRIETNEQQSFFLFFNPSNLINANGQANSVPVLPALPALGPLQGKPLPTYHVEENYSYATNQSGEIFADGTYNLTPHFSFTGGMRFTYESFKLNSQGRFVSGSESMLGRITGNYPNLIIKERPEDQISDVSPAFTYRAGFAYKFNEYANVFASISKGRRPKVLQFTSTGIPEILNAEIVKSYDLGAKMVIARKVYADVSFFYYNYTDFQSSTWVANPESGDYTYQTTGGGKATTYGPELSIRGVFIKGIEIFGNYAYIHDRFNITNSNGSTQEYAGNRFQYTPDHSFSVGANLSARLNDNINVIATPAYSYKTKVYFLDANTPGLEQPAYGMLSMQCGILFSEPALYLSFHGTNLLAKEYIASGGATLSNMFGIPTFTPGTPRLLGAKLTWSF